MKFLFDIAKETGVLNTFVSLAEGADLARRLNAPGQFTLFAPNDTAFENADEELLEQHTINSQVTKAFIIHHAAAGRRKESYLRSVKNITNMASRKLNITDEYGIIRISGARLLTQDIEAKNGIIHIIERIIWPLG